MSVTTSKKNLTIYLKYGFSSASTRERILRYKNSLKKNFRLKFNILISEEVFNKRIQKGIKKREIIFFLVLKRILSILFEKSKIVIIQHEILPYFPPFLEIILRIKKVKYIIDIDDAFFHRIYDSNFFIKNYFLFKFKITFSLASKIIVGNSFLKTEVKKLGGKNIHIIPTLVEIPKLSKYKKYKKFTVVWIGSQSTSKYLDSIKDAINLLHKHDVHFKIIGPYKLDFSFKNMKLVKWNFKTYKKILSKSHVGIMPLDNTIWEKGKCGYKILQYYSYGLPAIVSPIGLNKRIINENNTGFFVRKKKDWYKYLILLKNNKLKNEIMGNKGYFFLKKNFDPVEWTKKYSKIFRNI